MAKMLFSEIPERLLKGFKSPSNKTREWIKFANKFRNALKAELLAAGITIANFHWGDFTLGGFLTKKGKIVYFSVDLKIYNASYRPLDFDIQLLPIPNILLRSAKTLTDYDRGSVYHSSYDQFTLSVKVLLNRR